nr:hypothetical protein [bacterium]
AVEVADCVVKVTSGPAADAPASVTITAKAGGASRQFAGAFTVSPAEIALTGLEATAAGTVKDMTFAPPADAATAPAEAKATNRFKSLGASSPVRVWASFGLPGDVTERIEVTEEALAAGMTLSGSGFELTNGVVKATGVGVGLVETNYAGKSATAVARSDLEIDRVEVVLDKGTSTGARPFINIVEPVSSTRFAAEGSFAKAVLKLESGATMKARLVYKDNAGEEFVPASFGTLPNEEARGDVVAFTGPVVDVTEAPFVIAAAADDQDPKRCQIIRATTAFGIADHAVCAASLASLSLEIKEDFDPIAGVENLDFPRRDVVELALIESTGVFQKARLYTTASWTDGVAGYPLPDSDVSGRDELVFGADNLSVGNNGAYRQVEVVAAPYGAKVIQVYAATTVPSEVSDSAELSVDESGVGVGIGLLTMRGEGGIDNAKAAAPNEPEVDAEFNGTFSGVKAEGQGSFYVAAEFAEADQPTKPRTVVATGGAQAVPGLLLFNEAPIAMPAEMAETTPEANKIPALAVAASGDGGKYTLLENGAVAVTVKSVGGATAIFETAVNATPAVGDADIGPQGG